MFEDIRLNRSTLIIFLAIPALWLFFGYIYAEQRVQNLTANKYSEIANEMNNELQTLIQEKTETILIMAMSISNNPQIKNVLLTKTNKLELDEFSKELSETTTLKNIWFQVISADGTSLYRSWTKKHGDNLKEIRIDIREMIQNPKISSSISTGKFDLSFKSMVPLYNEGKFIGIVEVIAKFNSIAIKMERKGYDPVILVDKSYKNQLTKAFTKTFIKDYYVANLNAKKDLLTHIEEEGVSAFINKDKYFICDNNSQLISVYKLEDIYGKNMSYFYHFHDLNKIDLSEILYAKEKIFIFVFSVFIGIIGIYFYIYTTKYKQFVQKINTKLSKEVTKKTKEIHHIANHDDLTKLPNRVLFSDRLKQSIKHSKRDKKVQLYFF